MDNKQNIDKYCDDRESTLDVKFFYPLADLFLEPIHLLGLKPNDVTLISTIFTSYAAYCFGTNRFERSMIFYFLGYFMDSIDGRLARKYNQGSTLGMILDLLSDIISNLPLLYLFISKAITSYQKTKKTNKILLAIMIILMVILVGVFLGINDAITSYEKTKNDNFYLYKKKIVEEDNYHNTLIGKLYLFVYRQEYNSYRKFFPEPLNDETIIVLKKKLIKLKEFGTGNFTVFIIFMIYLFSRGD